MRKTQNGTNNFASLEETASLLKKTGIAESFSRQNDASAQLSAAKTRLKDAVDGPEDQLGSAVAEWLRIYKELGNSRGDELRLPVRIDVHPDGARALLPIAYPYDHNGGHVETLYRHFTDALGLGPRPRNYNLNDHVEVRKKGPMPPKNIRKLLTPPDGLDGAGIHVDVLITYSSDMQPESSGEETKSKRHKKNTKQKPASVSRWEPAEGSAGWNILRYGEKHGKVEFAGLSEKLGMPMGTISSTLMKLTEHGYCSKDGVGVYVFRQKKRTAPAKRVVKDTGVSEGETDFLQYVRTTESPTIQGYMETRKRDYAGTYGVANRLVTDGKVSANGRLSRDTILHMPG